MASRKDVMYVLLTVLLLGVIGLYLAFSKGQTINTIIKIPFRSVEPTEDIAGEKQNEGTGSSDNPTPEQGELSEGADYYAIFETNLGRFEVDLAEGDAPNSIKSFVFLAESRYYDNTIFHRYLPNLFIQGGSRNTLNDNPDDDRFGGPGYVIDDEINWDSLDIPQEKRDQLSQEGYSSAEGLDSLSMEKYAISWASSAPNTNGSQFFIVLGDKDSSRVKELEGRHTVFGKVVKGTEVIDQIAKLEVNLDNLDEPKPAQDVVLKSIKIEIR